MKKGKTIIFIEGESKNSNGDLRKGFRQLLDNANVNMQPYRLIMAGGRSNAVKKFKNNRLSDTEYLFVDLDAPYDDKPAQMKKLGLENQKDEVFFMVQEMEAWFLSQPKILDHYYNKKISAKLPNTLPRTISKPCDVLKKHTKSSGSTKGAYHKIKHGVDLLELLDIDQLQDDFPEFKALVKALSKL